MMAYVKGIFKVFDANIYIVGNNLLSAEVDLWIDAASIFTGDEKRDEHLKGANFLDVSKYKQITFSSSTIARTETDGNHELWGELRIRGITKNIKLDIHFGKITTAPNGYDSVNLSVSGTISRRDWDLNWNEAIETGGFLVGNEVEISCEIGLEKVTQKKLELSSLENL